MSTDTPPIGILIIDDSSVARGMMSRMFADAGCDVVTRESPIGASAQIMRSHVDAVIIDMNMPIMTGPQFVGILRSNRMLDHVLVVLVTGRTEGFALPSPKETGADLVLTKKRLPAEVDSILGRIRMGRSRRGV